MEFSDPLSALSIDGQPELAVSIIYTIIEPTSNKVNTFQVVLRYDARIVV